MQQLCKFNFEFDDFQQEAINHIENGKSVVVCAPTGAGKTVIAEYAVNIALQQNKRVFYTTPLKALSNQKFRDFQKALGPDKVGLLTGDISINRNAPIVVMTTEVFRNILYGTTLGNVEDNLNEVLFVILDECHYMNDSERGTVWEESIIYCPHNIQIIALSATIANAEELTGWINSVHNDTKLINSDFRPVPLRHFYFINDQLLPLTAPGGRVNKKIKQIKVHKGSYFRKNKKSPAKLINILQKREMLPAIYFCFSRKRCDGYLEMCSNMNLLSEYETKRLKKIINDYIEEYPVLAQNRHLQYIYSGVASHHAGLLPNWKVLIEKLFQEGLIKVVFATETLAAGINMPARTTIISDISKRSDDGHRTLTSSEFLQMSGRAGRRGMDKIGYVVTAASPYHNPSEVATLAMSDANPLQSQFTPTYSMVLNLLQRFKLDEARQLILSSFGYYTSSSRMEPLYASKKDIENNIEKVINFKCPYSLSNEDLISYHKKKEHYVELKKLYNTLKKQAHRAKRYNAPEVNEYRDKYEDLKNQLKMVQCYNCDLYKQHLKSLEVLGRYNKRLNSINKVIEIEKDFYWNSFLNLVNLLTEYNYLKDNVPTELGVCASYFRCENELFLVETINSGILDDLTPAEIAAVFCAMISEEPRGNGNVLTYPGKKVRSAINDIYSILKKIFKAQRKHNIDIDLLLNIQLSGITEVWASGAEWETVTSQTSLDEGDIVRTLKRTLDILRQVAHAPYVNPDLAKKCHEALKAINREPVLEIY
jgi:superfamily II RNA helicase